MDGDGHSSKPMCPISRSQPTTKKTASTATFRPSLPTGYTSKAIRSSNRNENPFSVKRLREVIDEGDCGDGSGCRNGRDEVDGAARAAGGGARQPVGRELRRCRCSGSCVGIHRG